MWRSCKSAAISGIFVAIFPALLLGQGAVAPPPSPTPAPTEKWGYVRLFNMRGDKSDQLSLVNPSLPPNQNPVCSGPPQNYFANYTKLAPGAYSFQLTKAGDAAAAPLKSVPLLLKGGSYFSVLATEKNGQFDVRIIDDAYALDKSPTGTVVVRDFWPAAEVTVTAGRPAVTVTVHEGEEAKLENLPLRILPIYIKAKEPNGATRTWNAETDLSGDKRRGTLFIIGDRYGRFRPCISEDGHAEDVAPPSKPGR